jgi:hypothetical protein
MRALVEEVRSLPGFEHFLRPVDEGRAASLLAGMAGPVLYVACSELGTVLVKLELASVGTLSAESRTIAELTLGDLLDRLLYSPVPPLLALQIANPGEVEAAASDLVGQIPGVIDEIVALAQDVEGVVHLILAGVLGLMPVSGGVDSQGGVPLVSRSIVVLPSLRVGSQEIKTATSERLGIVADATGDLAGTRLEALAVRAAHGRAESLVASQATRASVASLMSRVDILHFASHAAFSPDEPLASGLRLADGSLTAADLLQQGLNLPPRVVLSACQTAVYDFLRAPDEYTGLLTGFLARGAREILATLWPVSDIATCLIMARLYWALHDEVKALPDALSIARTWLAGASALEVSEAARAWFGPEAWRLTRHVDNYERDALPFANPYYWAGFVVVGGRGTV